MGDWSQLIPDLLVEIARRIPLVEDFTAFRGVCTSWRAAATNNNFVKTWFTVPLLMFADKEDSENRKFYSLSRGKIWRTMSLPEVRGKKCIETRGWLLTEGIYGELGLLHPFSCVQIALPRQTTFPDYANIHIYPPDFISRAVLSADPSDTSDFILVVIYGSPGMLGIWRPGDKYWTRIETLYHHERSFLSDVVFYHEKVYAIDIIGHIWDVSGPNDPTYAQFLLSIFTDVQLVPRVLYLVETSDALLIVERKEYCMGNVGDTDTDTHAVTNFPVIKVDFQVIQLDLIKDRWEQITSLADRAIFVGDNGTCSVDTTRFLGVIKPNCIYFIDEAMDGGGYDMSVYCLQDGKTEPFDDFQSFNIKTEPFDDFQYCNIKCRPIWVIPSL